MDESKPDVIEVPLPEAAVEVLPNGSEPAQLDPNYYYLSEPIAIDDKSVSRLRINPRGVLKGRQFFDLVNQYQRKFPDESRGVISKYTSENFLALVIAKLNQIAVEDLYKLDYGDLPLMFMQAQTFHFGAGAPLQSTTAATSPEP
jgi:hypothetical protein